MGIVLKQKTKTALNKIFLDGLSIALGQVTVTKPGGISHKTLVAVSSSLVSQLMVDDRFVECMSGIVPTKTKEWLTTEDAARLSGFSRPFIIALLDGPLYTGQVTRTDKGHRRVNRSEFEDWLKKASVSKSHPNTVAQVRAETQGDEPVLKKETEKQTKKLEADKFEAMAYARSKGLFNGR